MTKKMMINGVTVLFLLFIAFIIFAANTGMNLMFFRVIGAIPMGDKVAHMTLVGTMAFLVNLSLKNRTFERYHLTLLVGSTIVFCGITVEEFSQIWITNRTFDLIDLTFNYIGVFIASWFNLKLKY